MVVLRLNYKPSTFFHNKPRQYSRRHNKNLKSVVFDHFGTVFDQSMVRTSRYHREMLFCQPILQSKCNTENLGEAFRKIWLRYGGVFEGFSGQNK